MEPVTGLGLDARTIVVSGNGLVLREWREADLGHMPGLFDDPDVARWTPIESPFDADAAARYLTKASDQRAADSALHLVVTTDGEIPLGEVLLFVPPGGAEGSPPELGYSVSPAARGRGLAARATALLVEFAVAELGLRTFRLQITPGNAASQAIAVRLGALRKADSLTTVDGARGPVELETWDLHR
jgi:RimJ/RimL family protein N-acetyltransferase